MLGLCNAVIVVRLPRMFDTVHTARRLIANTQMNLWLCDGDGQVTPLREGFDKYVIRSVS